MGWELRCCQEQHHYSDLKDCLEERLDSVAKMLVFGKRSGRRSYRTARDTLHKGAEAVD